MKKALSVLLALLILLITAACASPGDKNSETSSADTDAGTGDNSTSSAETTIPENEIDNLGNVNFSGASYDILTRKSTSYEIKSDEISGDLVADAVHDRNVAVEERFGVNINIIELAGDWGDRDNFMAAVSNDVLAGTHDYDLVITHSAYIVNIAAKGCGYDMGLLENINFDKKWWCRKYVDNASMYGRYYTAMGDLGYTLYQYMMCIFFNKTIAASVNLPDLYEMVENGTWTFDKLKEYSYLIGQDLNGDGKHNELDRFGLGINNHTCRMTATFWDAKITSPNSEGRQVMNLPNEKYLGIYDMLYDLVYNHTENVFYIGEGSVTETNMFINEQLLFFSEKLGNAATMKDMQSEYGILPFPKYDEAQENYISSARDALSAILVVSDITDPTMVGTVTEALCMIGYQKITPSYYETSLKLKYLSDPTAMSMLDLIRDTMTFEFAATYTNSISLIFSTLGDNINKNVPSINSLVKASSKIWQNAIDKLYSDFEKLS